MFWRAFVVWILVTVVTISVACWIGLYHGEHRGDVFRGIAVELHGFLIEALVLGLGLAFWQEKRRRANKEKETHRFCGEVGSALTAVVVLFSRPDGFEIRKLEFSGLNVFLACPRSDAEFRATADERDAVVPELAARLRDLDRRDPGDEEAVRCVKNEVRSIRVVLEGYPSLDAARLFAACGPLVNNLCDIAGSNRPYR